MEASFRWNSYIFCSRARTYFSLVELFVCILGLVPDLFYEYRDLAYKIFRICSFSYKNVFSYGENVVYLDVYLYHSSCQSISQIMANPLNVSPHFLLSAYSLYSFPDKDFQIMLYRQYDHYQPFVAVFHSRRRIISDPLQSANHMWI